MNPNRYDKPLTDKGHEDPDKHYIGEALPRPTRVTDVIISEVTPTDGFIGVSPIPAREDHTHGAIISEISTELENDTTFINAVTNIAQTVVVGDPQPVERLTFNWPGTMYYELARSGRLFTNRPGTFTKCRVTIDTGTDEFSFGIWKNGTLHTSIVAGPPGGVGPFTPSAFTISIPFVAGDTFQIRMTNMYNFTATEFVVTLDEQ